MTGPVPEALRAEAERRRHALEEAVAALHPAALQEFCARPGRLSDGTPAGARRGRATGSATREGSAVLTAAVPLADLFGHATHLRGRPRREPRPARPAESPAPPRPPVETQPLWNAPAALSAQVTCLRRRSRRWRAGTTGSEPGVPRPACADTRAGSLDELLFGGLTHVVN